MSTTYDEIMGQPQAWQQTIATVQDQWMRIAPSLAMDPHTHCLFLGSGSSLYLGQTAAQVMQEVTGLVSTAVPSSDVFLSASSTVPRDERVIAFVVSRSGQTSEALMAAEYLREECPNV